MTENQFDPNDHTVDDVNAYLEAQGPGDERERVLQAERDGKARKGILVDTPGDGTTPGLDTSKGDTFDQAAAKATEPEGEAYQRGYFGHVPSRDGKDAVDLTLKAVTGQKDA